MTTTLKVQIIDTLGKTCTLDEAQSLREGKNIWRYESGVAFPSESFWNRNVTHVAEMGANIDKLVSDAIQLMEVMSKRSERMESYGSVYTDSNGNRYSIVVSREVKEK